MVAVSYLQRSGRVAIFHVHEVGENPNSSLWGSPASAFCPASPAEAPPRQCLSRMKVLQTSVCSSSGRFLFRRRRAKISSSGCPRKVRSRGHRTRPPKSGICGLGRAQKVSVPGGPPHSPHPLADHICTYGWSLICQNMTLHSFQSAQMHAGGRIVEYEFTPSHEKKR